MIFYKNKQVIERKAIKVGCDKCHEILSVGDDDLEIQEFLHIRFTGGYSSVFGDETEVECDLCQRCLKEMIDGLYRVKKGVIK